MVKMEILMTNWLLWNKTSAQKESYLDVADEVEKATDIPSVGGVIIPIFKITDPVAGSPQWSCVCNAGPLRRHTGHTAFRPVLISYFAEDRRLSLAWVIGYTPRRYTGQRSPLSTNRSGRIALLRNAIIRKLPK